MAEKIIYEWSGSCDAHYKDRVRPEKYEYTVPSGTSELVVGCTFILDPDATSDETPIIVINGVSNIGQWEGEKEYPFGLSSPAKQTIKVTPGERVSIVMPTHNKGPFDSSDNVLTSYYIAENIKAPDDVYTSIGAVSKPLKEIQTSIGGVKHVITEGWASIGGVKKLVYQVVKGSPIGDLPVGSIVKINENGKPMNYLIVHQGLPSDIYNASCNGTWLLRQDIAEKRTWDAGDVNKLESSDIHAYLNGTWLNRYDAEIRDIIKQAKIPYRRGGGENGTDVSGYSGIPCKAFLLSGKEVGFDYKVNEIFPSDGYLLSYFIYGQSASANEKRIATFGRDTAYWWLRSPDILSSYYVCEVARDGDWGSGHADGSNGIRPALIFPSSTLVDDLNNVIP